MGGKSRVIRAGRCGLAGVHGSVTAFAHPDRSGQKWVSYRRIVCAIGTKHLTTIPEGMNK